MDKEADTQTGGRQGRKPGVAGGKRRLVIAVVGILAVGLGAWAIWRHLTKPEEITLDLGNNVKMRLVLIPAGKFMMGSPNSELGLFNQAEGPQHEVTISKPFFMGVYEVTQEQYETVMGKNPSNFKGAQYPVLNVTWDDAAEFCKKLSARTGNGVRLPTEAQWEYACRAGTTTPYNTGDALRPDQARVDIVLPSSSAGAWEKFMDWLRTSFHLKAEERRQGPAPVGSFPSNGFGLCDMCGNAWEWCSDWCGKDYYANSPAVDPQGPNAGDRRVLRGGSWAEVRGYCRSAYRGAYEFHAEYARGHRPQHVGGFRVVVLPGSE